MLLHGQPEGAGGGPSAEPVIVGVGVDEDPDERAAVRRAMGMAYALLPSEPKLLLLFCTRAYDLARVLGAARVFSGPVPLIGGTSCSGVLSASGFTRPGERPRSVGVMAIGGSGVTAAVAQADLGEDPSAAGRQAAEAARATAPDASSPIRAAILLAPPGHEEAILSGISAVIGRSVPLLGFTVADPDVGGSWVVFSGNRMLPNSCAVALLYGDFVAGAAFSAGYWPTAHVARAGQVEGRMLGRLDGRPAAEVYAEWLGTSPGNLRGPRLRQVAALAPLAVEDTRTHRLIVKEPGTISADGRLGLFADVREGDLLRLLTATPESLVPAAGAAVSEAAMRAGLSSSSIKGVLMAQGAGRVRALREHASEVALQVRHIAGPAALLGASTFGEQSQLPDGRPVHLNLTTSVLVFGY